MCWCLCKIKENVKNIPFSLQRTVKSGIYCVLQRSCQCISWDGEKWSYLHIYVYRVIHIGYMIYAGCYCIGFELKIVKNGPPQ